MIPPCLRADRSTATLRFARNEGVRAIVHSAAKAADSSQRKWNYGVLTTRKPLPPYWLRGGFELRSDARHSWEEKAGWFQSPPRNKRFVPVVGPVGLVTLPDE